ncbi:hypothetical protein C1I92_09930 [Jiangella anatolica]|uniref:Uncharacterized protein n=2 Tax=Jiangella anatolica TaxID=2670374 RepID=A0A2W2C7H4_9ACTN|nr:hypothetical protein C1I92_09930 [Jiangella anatolica]
MKLPMFSHKPTPQVREMSVADCYEAFMHASETYRNSEAVDRWKIGPYLDAILDQYLELQ